MLNKIRKWVAGKMWWRVIEYHTSKEDVDRLNTILKARLFGNTEKVTKQMWVRWYGYTSNRDRAIREDEREENQDNVTELFKT